MATDGFLGRWSRRKLDEGKGGSDETPPSPQPSPVSGPGGEMESPSPRRGEGGGEGQTAAAPPPTLEDVNALTPESDFKPFLTSGVAPEVRNAAMKKLFADPRFNIMDRLDTYIDDYSKPDPIPEAMLRRMASAKFLKLFDDEKEPEQAGGRDDGDTRIGQSVAESGLSPPGGQRLPEPLAVPTTHADPDLRLQPDHAAPAKDAGPGTG
jgi:hypothetical protein